MELSIVLSVIAVALSSAALGWQVLSFLLNGARVKAELVFGVTYSNGRVVSSPAARWAKIRTEELGKAGDPQGSREFVQVRAVNKGRGKTQLQDVELMIDRTYHFINSSEVKNPELPYSLDGWSSESWRFELSKFTAGGALDRRADHVLRAHVILGNGRKTRSPKFKLPKTTQD